MNKIQHRKDLKKKHTCTKCGSAFNRPYRLKQHEKTHEKIKSFKCGELNCNKSYFTKQHLDRHISTVHIKQDFSVIYSCPQCMKNFVNRQNLKRHIKSWHGGSLLSCDVCHCRFKKKHQIRAHMYEHTFVKSFSCELCNVEFISLTEKKKHTKQHKTYNCNKCDMTFVQWSHYLKHKKTHLEEYHCHDCGRKFNKRIYIVRHMKIHNTHYTPKLYPCTYENCDRVYTRNNNLTKHINVKHLKIKYECDICFVKLSCKAKLLIHQNSHKKPKDSFLQPTKDMGRMLRCDKGAAKVSTALRIAGLIVDPENECIKGTLKSTANFTAVKASDKDMLADACEQSGEVDTISEQDHIVNSKSEQNHSADSNLEQKISSENEQNKVEQDVMMIDIADSENNGGAPSELTSESYNPIEVISEKSQPHIETNTFNKNLKPGFTGHSVQIPIV